MNIKLALKVLKMIDEDLHNLEGTLATVNDEDTKIKLFKQCRELRLKGRDLQEHYQKVFNRTAK